MKQKILLLLPALFCLFSIHAQVFTNSNLPIVIIRTDNADPIQDESEVYGNMKLIYRGPGLRNYMTDQDSLPFLNYDGRIKIEIRGSYSQAFPKKAYGFSTLQADDISNNNVSLLGMPSENDWVLNALSSDPALIRDYLSYNLSRQLGQYASRTAYCEVVVNGDYRGLYLLEEKIKADKNRVDISKIGAEDMNLPELSGGYITKTDKTTGGDPVAWYMSSYVGTNDCNFIHSWPKPEEVSTAQNNYIKSVFQNLQTACASSNSSISTGYPSIIDVPSFVDFILINELASNVDAYTFSTYYHKDQNGKLRAGPVWDLNLTYGNDLFQFGVDRSKPNVWQFSNGDNEGPKYIRDLFNKTSFKCYLSRRWTALSQQGQPLHLQSLEAIVDNAVAQISEAVVRENARWSTIGNHPFAITTLKSWLGARIPWLTSRLSEFSACENIDQPALVISKIHYHPDTSLVFPDEDQLEFLEITNAGTTAVDLSGIYFGGTGLVYQFPLGASLPAGMAISLASDITTFKARYGTTPFGQFTRNLSNAGQNLQLADAFGNEIDRVHYADDAPWPDADGNGKYLQLISLDLDNSLASSWEAVGVSTSGTDFVDLTPQIKVFPNPTNGQVQIHSEQLISRIELTDLQGKKLAIYPIINGAYSIDLAPFPAGLYFIKIATANGIWVEKVLKG